MKSKTLIVGSSLLAIGLCIGMPGTADASLVGAQSAVAPMMAASDTPRRGAQKRQQKRQTAGRREGTRSTTVTGRKGRTAERTTTREVDEENRSARTTRTTTGPEGRTSTRTTDTARTDNGYTRDTQWEGPNGQTGTRNSEGTWDPETQTWNRDVVATGPNGNSRSVDVDAARTENGATRTATRTNARGESVTRTQSVERESAADDTDAGGDE